MALTTFTETTPSLEDFWRSIILLGRNVASYKFALGKSLLELADQDRDAGAARRARRPVRPPPVRAPEAFRQAGHLRPEPVPRCLPRLQPGRADRDQLIEQTARLGFSNVIDAFHVVNQGEVPVRFFIDERRQSTRGIRLTDDLRQVREDFQYRNLPAEVEARWRLVETAWDLDLPRHVLAVTYEPRADLLVVEGGKVRRRAITGSREALNGYQKGRCFYCRRDIEAAHADVDHFLPHTLCGSMSSANYRRDLEPRPCLRRLQPGAGRQVRPSPRTAVPGLSGSCATNTVRRAVGTIARGLAIFTCERRGPLNDSWTHLASGK